MPTINPYQNTVILYGPHNYRQYLSALRTKLRETADRFAGVPRGKKVAVIEVGYCSDPTPAIQKELVKAAKKEKVTPGLEQAIQAENSNNKRHLATTIIIDDRKVTSDITQLFLWELVQQRGYVIEPERLAGATQVEWLKYKNRTMESERYWEETSADQFSFNYFITRCLERAYTAYFRHMNDRDVALDKFLRSLGREYEHILCARGTLHQSFYHSRSSRPQMLNYIDDPFLPPISQLVMELKDPRSLDDAARIMLLKDRLYNSIKWALEQAISNSDIDILRRSAMMVADKVPDSLADLEQIFRRFAGIDQRQRNLSLLLELGDQV